MKNFLRPEKIEEQIEVEKNLAAETDRMNDHKLAYSNPHEREVERLKALLVFTKYDVNFEYDGGTVLVNNKYIFACRSGKWRVKDHHIWYRSRGAKDFLERFVKAKPKENT